MNHTSKSIYTTTQIGLDELKTENTKLKGGKAGSGSSLGRAMNILKMAMFIFIYTHVYVFIYVYIHMMVRWFSD